MRSESSSPFILKLSVLFTGKIFDYLTLTFSDSGSFFGCRTKRMDTHNVMEWSRELGTSPHAMCKWTSSIVWRKSNSINLLNLFYAHKIIYLTMHFQKWHSIFWNFCKIKFYQIWKIINNYLGIAYFAIAWLNQDFEIIILFHNSILNPIWKAFVLTKDFFIRNIWASKIYLHMNDTQNFVSNKHNVIFIYAGNN